MNRKTLTVLGIFTAGLVLLSLVFLTGNTSAKNRTLKEVLFPQNPQTSPNSQAAIATKPSETDSTPTVFPEGMLNPPTQVSSFVLNDDKQLKKNADVVAQVEVLLEKSEILSATATWIHFSIKTEGFITMSEKMPDGSPIPMVYTTDSWYRLDENGYQIQGVTIQDTGSPTTSQVAVFKNGIWYNLTLGTSTDTGNPADIKPRRPADHTILEQALLSKDSVRLDFGYTEINDQRVAEYTMINENVNPFESGIPGYLVKGYAYKYYLSLETGEVVMMEFFFINADGNLDLVQRNTTIVVEKINEPSTEILKYLE